MKLIIEIPKRVYDATKTMGNVIDADNEIVAETIANGIPIPDNSTFGEVIEIITNRKPLEDIKDADNIMISTKLWNSPYRSEVHTK